MYYFFLLIFLTLSLFGVILSYPDYNNSYFPLFLDLQTILIFIPSYSILFYGVFLHLIKNKLKKTSFLKSMITSNKLTCLYIITITAFILYIQDFYSLKIKILLLIPSTLIGFLINFLLDVLLSNRK